MSQLLLKHALSSPHDSVMDLELGGGAQAADETEPRGSSRWSRLPPGAIGTALGLGGLSTLIDTCIGLELHRDGRGMYLAHGSHLGLGLSRSLSADPSLSTVLPAEFHVVHRVLLFFVLLASLAYACKTIFAPLTVLSELLDPRKSPSLGALAMCGMLLSPWPLGAAWLPLPTCGALLVTACHLEQSRRHKLPLEPSSFAANVSIGLFPIVGTHAGFAAPARDACFCLALLLSVVTTPPVLLHLARSRAHVADPSIWQLAAPWALLAAGWHVSDGGARTPAALGTLLCSLALALLALTAGLTVLRARPIAETFFTPIWAAFTFPTCTSATALLHYAARLRSPALALGGLTLAAAAAVAVFAVAGLTAWHLPGWLREVRGREDSGETGEEASKEVPEEVLQPVPDDGPPAPVREEEPSEVYKKKRVV